MHILLSAALLIAGAASARALDIPGQVGALAAGDFATRARAVKELSAAKTSAEADAIIGRFRQELACAAAKPAPRNCHDPRFVYNALLVAGNLAEKYTGAPWDFLVALSQGGTINEGSFFQDKRESDEHRGSDYFTPAVPDGKLTREYLQATLDKVIEKAGLMPSCGWPLARIKSLTKKTHDAKGYQVYSYSRDYSPKGILGQYRVLHARDWLYSGDRLVNCGDRTAVADLGQAGLYFASISDRSDEQHRLDIDLYSLPAGTAACGYTVEGVSELDPEPLAEVAAAPVMYLPVLFDFAAGKCRPKKVAGYTYSPLER